MDFLITAEMGTGSGPIAAPSVPNASLTECLELLAGADQSLLSMLLLSADLVAFRAPGEMPKDPFKIAMPAEVVDIDS